MQKHIFPNYVMQYDQQEAVGVWSDFDDTTLYKSEVIEYLFKRKAKKKSTKLYKSTLF